MKRDKYKITDKYVLFSGSFLSNWWPCTETFVVTCNDKQYIMPSSEHYYMFLKAFFFAMLIGRLPARRWVWVNLGNLIGTTRHENVQ